MTVTDKQVQDFEKLYKDSLFKKIDEVCAIQARLISSFEQTCTYLGIKGDLYNIGIAINNKINELSQRFKQAGISFFSSKIKDYGILNLNMVSTSFIGDAISTALFDIVTEDADLLNNLDLSLEKLQKEQALQKSNPIKNFFSKLRSYFIPPQSKTPSSFQQYKEIFSSFKEKHNEIANQIYNYTLEENLISSLASFISERSYLQSEIPELLNESVTPDLEKLGLSHLLPQLNKELSKMYEEKTKSTAESWKLPPEVQAKLQKHQQQLAAKYNLEPPSENTNLKPNTQEEKE